MRKDEKKNHKKIDELTPEQQELILLLRQKSENTPIPMALQPEMMMQRLPDTPRRAFPRLRVPSLRTISGVAAALGACAAILLGRGNIQQYLNSGLSVESSPSESEPSDSSLSDPSTDSEENHFPEPSDNSEPSSEVQTGTISNETESSISSASSSPENSVSSESSQIKEENTSPESSGSSDILPSGEISKERTTVIEPSTTSTVLPSRNGADYAEIYDALQKAVTPQNAVQQYTTAVLSAGISADGLQPVQSKKTIVASDGQYFYVSSQNARTVSIQKGSESSGETVSKIYVEFESPIFDGLSVSSSAITDCFYSNGELFVVGTVSYTGSKGNKTVSAINCYNVSDPSSPYLISSCAQDGTMIGAAMSGSYLYVFSRYYPDTTVQQNNPAAYIPLFYKNGKAEIPTADNISISQAETDSYVVAASYSSKNPQDLVDCNIIQGCGKNFFLGESGLYLFEEKSAEMQTLISGITYSSGRLSVVPETTVAGLLSNLTLPNEYGSTLRILTTSYGSSDDTHLYIFDRSLNLLGKAESFLENSVLRSVRFDRNCFYYTLYGFDGQIYELDLSDPGSLSGAETTEKAEKTEEALLSVNAGGNYTVRLTGQKGHTELTLTLRLSGLEKGKITLSVPGGYDESQIHLQYLGEDLVYLTYSEGYNDICKVYRCGSDGLTELISTSVTTAENGKGYLQNGYFFLITSERTLIFDAETGKPADTATVPETETPEESGEENLH